MRIAILHSPYLSGPASGENRIVEEEVRLLRDAGHDVSTYIPPRAPTGPWGAAREGFSAVWSRTAVHEVRTLIREQRVEVVHVHNPFPALSPAVLRAAAGAAVPIVVTLHNFRLLCLPSTFLRDGKICELCHGRSPWRGVVHRCYRGSAAASASLASSLALHRVLGTFQSVTLYLAVTEFLRSKYVSAGFSADRVTVRLNWAHPGIVREGPGEYYLFVGRLSREKGVDRLLAAWQGIDAPLVVAGDGPDASRLQEGAPHGVRFTGRVEASEVAGLLSRARALVLPSVWYEGSPVTIAEAYAAGVPVLASAIGGIPEHVRQGKSGLLFAPEGSDGIAAAVKRLLDDNESERLGDGALRLWRERFSPERGLESLLDAFERALELGR